MITRRSFQAEQVAIDQIDREIIMPLSSKSQKKVEQPTSPPSPSPPSEHGSPTSPSSRGKAPCRGEPGSVEHRSPASPHKSVGGNGAGHHVKWKGEDPKEEQQRKERKDSAQEIIAKEEEVGKRNMMERLKDIVEVRKEEVRRKENA